MHEITEIIMYVCNFDTTTVWGDINGGDDGSCDKEK